MPSDAAIASLLNAAWAEAAALPRVVAWPVEIAPLTAQDVAARRAQGWLGEGLFTVERDGELISLVDVTPSGELGRIGWFGTAPTCQRQGLASDCLRRALGYLKTQGVTRVETESFIDSRIASACGFLEANGLTVLNPQGQNIVMQIDMQQYEPVPISLAPGYRIEVLTPERVPLWLDAKDRVFGGSTPPDWFEKTFSHRWDFEWDGWLTLWHGDEIIGLSGADMFRDPAHPESYCGAQIEYVGVLESHRGRRLGEMIVRACLNHIKERGVPCQLITQPFRIPAITLYERLGFRHVRENRTYEMTL